MTAAASSFARLLTGGSMMRYALWRLAGRRGEVSVRLVGGPTLLLRSPTIGNNDYGVAYEVFVHRYYQCPRPLPLRNMQRVVDLGANVGFSCLYWLTECPRAEVIAFEPHPAHYRQCEANLQANRALSRVRLYRAAAGTTTQKITLSDAGTSSTVIPNGGAGIETSMIDVLDLLAGQAIDLIKLDIEGGEYAILEDPRFPRLNVSTLVMEWHNGPDGRSRCLSRLDQLNYEVLEIFNHGFNGMLWAFRREPQVSVTS